MNRDKITAPDGKDYWKINPPRSRPNENQNAVEDGYEIVDDKGYEKLVITSKPPEEIEANLVNTKLRAYAKINNAAEAKRLQYITPGAGQANSYRQKYEEALAFLDDTDPQAGDYPYIFLEAAATGAGTIEVAQLIVSTRNLFVQLDAVIESKRRGYVVAIDAAGTKEDVESILESVSYELPD
jgi:hypothetical protein